MHYPLGENPVLVSRVRVKTREDGLQLLCMHPDQGQGIELSMDNNLLHSFYKLKKHHKEEDLHPTIETSTAVNDNVQVS